MDKRKSIVIIVLYFFEVVNGFEKEPKAGETD